MNLSFLIRYAISIYDLGMNNTTNDKQGITPLGVTCYRDIRKRFGIKRKNRRGHIYVIGQTGTGKSTLIQNMVISDIKDGEGVGLVDPHGDLAEEVLDFIPKERIDDVIYINPADLEWPIAFNPLRKVKPSSRHLVVSGLLSVFKKIWPEFWGPRLEHILRHALLTLLEYPMSTLLDVPRLLTNADFRKTVLRCVTSREVREFWALEFDKLPARLRSEAISPILNKVGQFLTAAPLRNIVGQKENTFSLRQAMDGGRIVIANLAKGRFGEDNSALLGAMIVNQIQLAATNRADIPEAQRRPFYLAIDEFHAFATLAFSNILAESRKYGLSLVLAHQYIEQMDERVRGAVFGNVGTIISFRVGAHDAEYLAEDFRPVFSQEDLVRLPNFHVYLKMMIDGVSSRPFSATTLQPPARGASHKDEIVRRSRERYARPRKEVEASILSRSPLTGWSP